MLELRGHAICLDSVVASEVPHSPLHQRLHLDESSVRRHASKRDHALTNLDSAVVRQTPHSLTPHGPHPNKSRVHRCHQQPHFLTAQRPRSDTALPRLDVTERSFRRHQRDPFRQLLVSLLHRDRATLATGCKFRQVKSISLLTTV